MQIVKLGRGILNASRNKKKGFTLIELLAVIVILAVIALIVTPVIINVIENARKKTFESAAYGVLEGLKLEYVERTAQGTSSETKLFVFPNSGLKLSGEEPNDGISIIDNSGNIYFTIFDKDKRWCARKEFNAKYIKVEDYDKEKCKIDNAFSYIVSKIGEKTNGYNGCTGDGVLTDEGKYGIRYQGKCPNNYVNFNDELWRIIGIVDGKVKIVRYKSIGKFAFNLDKDGNTNSDWTSSSLMSLLNNGAYYNKTAGKYYKKNNDKIEEFDMDFSSNGLNEGSKKFIDSSLFYLGGISSSNITKSVMFEKEREKNVFSKNKTVWTGKIGLIYPSDYGYASKETMECTKDEKMHSHPSKCTKTNWLHGYNNILTMTTHSSYNNSIYYAYAGYIGGLLDVGRDSSALDFDIYPTVYLKIDAKLIDGDGTPNNPYILSI